MKVIKIPNVSCSNVLIFYLTRIEVKSLLSHIVFMPFSIFFFFPLFLLLGSLIPDNRNFYITILVGLSYYLGIYIFGSLKSAPKRLKKMYLEDVVKECDEKIFYSNGNMDQSTRLKIVRKCNWAINILTIDT